MPIMMINGEFLILDDDYKLDFERSIRNTIMNTLLHYTMTFNFNYDNTKELVESLTSKILRTIEFHKEQEKLQNQSKEAKK